MTFSFSDLDNLYKNIPVDSDYKVDPKDVISSLDATFENSHEYSDSEDLDDISIDYSRRMLYGDLKPNKFRFNSNKKRKAPNDHIDNLSFLPLKDKITKIDDYASPNPIISDAYAIGNLPFELKEHICGYLDVRSIGAFAKVNKEFSRVASIERIWKSLFENKWPLTVHSEIPRSWRSQFRFYLNKEFCRFVVNQFRLPPANKWEAEEVLKQIHVAGDRVAILTEAKSFKFYIKNETKDFATQIIVNNVESILDISGDQSLLLLGSRVYHIQMTGCVKFLSLNLSHKHPAFFWGNSAVGVSQCGTKIRICDKFCLEFADYSFESQIKGFTCDAGRILCLLNSGEAWIIDLKTHAKRRLETSHTEVPRTFLLHFNKALFCYSSREILCIDLENDQEVYRKILTPTSFYYEASNPIPELSRIAVHNGNFAAGYSDGYAVLLQLETGTILREFISDLKQIQHIALHDDYLVMADEEKATLFYWPSQDINGYLSLYEKESYSSTNCADLVGIHFDGKKVLVANKEGYFTELDFTV